MGLLFGSAGAHTYLKSRQVAPPPPLPSKVGDIPSVKLTKKGDRLSGTIGRCRNFLSKHANEHIDLVLLAGTNDLASRHVSPEDLIKKLHESINELTEFHNLLGIYVYVNSLQGLTFIILMPRLLASTNYQ